MCREALQASVSQLIFPTQNPVGDRTAFRSSKAMQHVTFLLTGSQLSDGRNNSTKYTAYQPSVESMVRLLLIIMSVVSYFFAFRAIVRRLLKYWRQLLKYFTRALLIAFIIQFKHFLIRMFLTCSQSCDV
jgi:hypothetical protein